MPPQRQPLLDVREGEVHHEVQAPGEGLVDVGPQVGGEQGDAVEGLQALEQVGALHVGVLVVCVLDLGALAEDGVRLVEEQHGVGAVGLREDPLQVLLGLADVLVHHRRQLHHVQVQAQVGGDHLRRQGLAGAGLAREQAEDAPAAPAARAEPPVAQHAVAMAGAQGEFA